MRRSTDRKVGYGEKVNFSRDELVRRSFASAKEYAQLYESSNSGAHFFNDRLRCVLELIPSVGGGRLLDVGCGPGVLLSRLADRQFGLFGLDFSPEMIAEARARTAGPNVNLMVGRIQHLPFRAGSFDVILALGILEYLPDPSTGLIEIARVAKPDAVIIVSMLNKLSLYRWWQRFVDRPWKVLRQLLRGRRPEPKPTLWLHSRKSLIRMVKACQLEPVSVVYYNLNVCVPPFDSKYPKRASELNRWVRSHCARWLFRFVHTAFILACRNA